MRILKTRNGVKALGLAAVALGLMATPALGAPTFSLSFTSSPKTLERTDEGMFYSSLVTNTGSTPTSGIVTVDFELPAGKETLAVFVHEPVSRNVSPAGWSCVRQPPLGALSGRVTCTRSDPLATGKSYPPILLDVHLGEDAPEVGVTKATVSGGGVLKAASKEVKYTFTPGKPFGLLANSFASKIIDEFDNPYTAAGGHPFAGYATFGFNAHRTVLKTVEPTEQIKDVVVDTPRGFVGNALTVSEYCHTIAEVIAGICPVASAVAGANVYAPPTGTTGEIDPYPDGAIDHPFVEPIYALEPEFGVPAQFAFGVAGLVPVTFVPELRPEEGYAISFRTAPVTQVPRIFGSDITLCGFGAKVTGVGSFGGCRAPTEPGANSTPLITNPTRCSGPPPSTVLKIDSWQHPAEIKAYDYTSPATTECGAVKFEPESALIPTNHEADTPTGLGVELKMPLDGVLSNTGVSQANLDTVTVTFPKGMSINAAAADGLQACTLAQVKLHSNAADECPESSRLGTIEIDTPLIRETLHGSIYAAAQNDNPFSTPIGLYMVFSSKRDGVTVKIAGKVVPDPVSGQLVSTFTENPEWPFSRLALHFTSGPRAPLVNPPKCGTYAIHSEFSPWSAVNPANPTADEIVSQDSSYEVTSGPNGSPCPTDPLAPRLKAGLKTPQAGSKSPFVFTLSRDDGTQRFSKIDVTTPKGLTASLKGVPYCSDAVLAGISSAEETGRPEMANPSCPAASQVGTSQAGAGSGPFPFYAPGRVYLAGPYKGAPVSLAIVTPAVSGPFDLGNVVVRNPLYIDPVTSQVKTESDPIPTTLHNIVLNVRDIRVALDRPNFTQAPTNCEPMAVDAHVSGLEGGDARLSNRFQVGGCESLGFKPKLGFRLFGGTHRGSHPRLRATVRMPLGGANIASTSVALPHSEFLDQSNIKTVCTRVQFAAKQCPPGSIYGEAEATSPLLDSPVRGPVILRSSDHPLPDVVLALKGPDSQPIEIDLAGRVDSVHGGIRTTFEQVPDQPVSSFTLNLLGGSKGLLVNSKNICIGTQKATAVFGAQNGRSATLRPVMKNACAKQRKGGKHKSDKHAHKGNGR